MTDQGITVYLDGSRSQAAAYNTGSPNQTHGNYNVPQDGAAMPGGMTFDRGITISTGQKQVTPAQFFGYSNLNRGTYTTVWGLTAPNDRNSDFAATVLMNNNKPEPLPIPTGTSSVTKYYQMVGYYTTGAVYESFVVTGSPATPTTTNPNTGHTLVNTFVASFWEI